MIATDYEVCAAVVLADERVEDRFARPGVAHGGGIHGQEYAVLGIVILEQDLVAAHSHVGRDIIGLRLAHKWMQQQAVYDFERALLNVLVRAVDGIPRLEADDSLPAALCEGGPRLRRRQAVLPEVVMLRQRDHVHGATQKHIALGVDRRDAGMGLVLRAVDLTRLKSLVVAELLLDLHGRQRGAVLV